MTQRGFQLVRCEHPWPRLGRRAYRVIHDELGFIGTIGTMPGGWWSQLAIEPAHWTTKNIRAARAAAEHLVWRAKSEAEYRSTAKG